MNEAIITIPSKINKGEELIAIPRSLYEKFSRWQSEEKIVDKVIASGERELKQGKTIIAKSSKHALKAYVSKRSGT